jgi:hypothetical protein
MRGRPANLEMRMNSICAATSQSIFFFFLFSETARVACEKVLSLEHCRFCPTRYQTNRSPDPTGAFASRRRSGVLNNEADYQYLGAITSDAYWRGIDKTGTRFHGEWLQ